MSAAARWPAGRAAGQDGVSAMNPNLAAAELWLTLAQAFLPPTRTEVSDAFRHHLAGDLESLAGALGLDLGPDLAALRASLAARPDGEALLVEYSGLFLAPPVKARLNLGWYLDGSLYGPSEDAILASFAHYGVERSERFKDLPDHLSSQLEFMALLETAAGEGGELPRDHARRFLLPALPGLCRDIETAGADSPYLHLARIVAAALEPLAAPGHDEAAPRRRNRRRFDPDDAAVRRCKVCGKPFARDKEIRIMARALAEHGLPAGHLDTCPDCRAPAMGWHTRAIR